MKCRISFCSIRVEASSVGLCNNHSNEWANNYCTPAEVVDYISDKEKGFKVVNGQWVKLELDKQEQQNKDEDISKLQTNYEMLRGDMEGLRKFCEELQEEVIELKRALQGNGLAR